MLKYITIGAIVTILLLVTACGTDSSIDNAPPQAATGGSEVIPTANEESSGSPAADGEIDPSVEVAAATFTATATVTPQPTATGTPVPTETPLPHTPTPTNAPEVIKVVTERGLNVNVRGGPGTNYPVIGQLAPGEEAAVTGFNADQTWWEINFSGDGSNGAGWVYGDIVEFSGEVSDLALAETPPTPVPPTAEAVSPASESEVPETSDSPVTENAAEIKTGEAVTEAEKPISPEELADSLRCGKDFCVTYQAMVPIWENGGCIGNHSIFVTVLEGPPPGRPLDGIVIGDTFGNVEVASGSKGPGTAEFTLWMNSMSVKVKRHIDGTEYTSEESFSFTSHDELIPAEVLAASGYCDGSVEKCRVAQQQNQICRGHYSWRVTFHKFD